jgi:hypothetical protein
MDTRGPPLDDSFAGSYMVFGTLTYRCPLVMTTTVPPKHGLFPRGAAARRNVVDLIGARLWLDVTKIVADRV